MELHPCIALVALFAAPVHGAEPPAIEVPEVEPVPVLLDGRFDRDEWGGAAAIAAAPGLRLLVKQSRGHVYLAVDTPGATPQPMDLHLLPGDPGRYHQLHASMQIGERQPTRDNPDPEWRWGNHVDWIASEIKRDPTLHDREVFSEQLYPADGTEYQVMRARFPGGAWRVRLTIDGVPGNDRDFVYPAGSLADDPATWAIWHLDG